MAENGASVTPREVLDGFVTVTVAAQIEQAAVMLRGAHKDDPDLVGRALVEEVEALLVVCKDRLWLLVDRLHNQADAAAASAESEVPRG